MAIPNSLSERIVDQNSYMILVTEPKGSIIYVNPMFCKISGYSVEESIGKNPRFLKSGMIPASVYQNMWGSLLKGKEWHGEIINRKKSGELYWSKVSLCCVRDKTGNVSHYVAMYEDISARKTEEVRPIESAVVLKEISELVPEGLFIIDKEEKVVFTNKAVENILGYSKEDLLRNQTLQEISFRPRTGNQTPSGAQEDGQHGMKGGVHEELAHRSVETLFTRIDGEQIFIEITLSSVKTESQDWIVGLVRDITERKSREHKILNQNIELSEFTHNMAHDLRNSLSTISMTVLLLGKEYKRETLDKIERQVTEINNILTRSVLLAEAGLVAQKTDICSLRDLFLEVSEACLSKEVKLEALVDLKVKCDRQKIFQVFKNIFENNIKHGGAKTITITTKRSKGGIAVLIANDGTLFAEESLKIIRSDQKTLSSKRKGGLGFTIINKIIIAHGWSLRLENTPTVMYVIEIPEKDLIREKIHK